MLLMPLSNYSLLLVYIRIITLTLIFDDHPLVEYPQERRFSLRLSSKNTIYYEIVLKDVNYLYISEARDHGCTR